MENEQGTQSISTRILMAKMAMLKTDLADKNLFIANQTLVITERETSISKLTGELHAANFQLEQMRRMIFGSKREYFVSNIDINQMRIELNPKRLKSKKR